MKLFLQGALQSLSNIFGLSIEELKLYITGTHVHNWVADPLCKGGYSYNTITTKAAKNILRTPVANTLFFAGESLSKHSNATVDAALESGKEVAEWILGNV